MTHLKTVKIERLDSQLQAFGHLASFIFYCITHPFKPVSVILWLVVSLNTYQAMDYLTSTKARIKLAEPVSQTTAFSLLPIAMAEQPADSIKINGRVYGFKDPDYNVWKLRGKPTLLIHNIPANVIITVEVDALTTNQLRQYKK